MALPTITPLPTAPARTMSNDAFVAAADAFLGALPGFATEMNALAGDIPAALSPANFNTVSTSSNTIGTGNKGFGVEPGKLLFAGQWLLIASSATPSKYMVGQVTTYDAATGALIVNVVYSSGTGTLASWTIGPAPVPAANLNPRADAAANSGTITPDGANAELTVVAAASGALTIALPSGSPVDGQKMMLRIKDNGTSRALTWNAGYRPFGSVALPSATTPGKWLYVAVIYNATDSKWDAIGAAVQQ